jgi:hypothetical protein
VSGPLLNYTTTVPVDRTVAEVQAMLGRAGAATVATAYEDGQVAGVSFVLRTPVGDHGYVLPVLVAPVRKVLAEQSRQGKLGAGAGGKLTRAAMLTEAHAARVAWRIAKDWLEAQLALVAAGLASLDQVMLPYEVMSTGRTVYEEVRAQERAALTAAGSER